MRNLKRALAAVAVGAIVAAGCGGGTPSGLIKAGEGGRQKNSSLTNAGTAGLNAQVYKMNWSDFDLSKRQNTAGDGLEPQIKRSTTRFPKCGSGTVVPNLDGLSKVMSTCDTDLILVNYTGYLTIPGTPGESVEVGFKSLSDDGFSMKLGDSPVIDSWEVQSCSEGAGKSQSTQKMIAGTSYPVDAWYFQGIWGYCMQLQWNLDGQGWEVVPASAFSTEDQTVTAAPATTTTLPSASTTTVPSSDSTTKSSGDATSEETATTVAEGSGVGSSESPGSTAKSSGSSGSGTATTTGDSSTDDSGSTDSTVASSVSVDPPTGEVPEYAVKDQDSNTTQIVIIVIIALLLLGVLFFFLRRRKDSAS